MSTILTRPPDIDPAVWRPETPLIVDELCDTPDQVAVWRAIRWLLAAYPNRRGFGTRDIARRAKVNRKKVSKIVDKLATKGLVTIVGYEHVGFPTPRPIYSIDLKRLERDSNDITPEVLLHWHIYDPPPPPVPNQMELFPGAELAQTHGNNQPQVQAHGPGSPHAEAARHQHGPELTHEHGSVSSHAIQEPETAPECDIATAGADVLQNKQAEHGAVLNTHGPKAPHAHGPDQHHLEGGREGEKERENHTPAQSLSLPELIRQEIRQALTDMAPEMGKPSAAASEAARHLPPPAPPGHPDIPAAPTDLWRDLYPEPRAFDMQQLAALACEHDQSTGGYGAYWLSKAILSAGLAHEQPTIRLIKAILDRWRADGSYGSDAPAYERRNGTGQHHGPGAAATQALPHGDDSPPASPALAEELHPAVSLYIERTGQQPNPVQVESLGEVTDMAVWGQVLTDWLANGWNTKAVAKMLDAYQKRSGSATVAEERVSSLEIDLAPIHPTDRGLWAHRFREAATAAEKRHVLERFRQWVAEHQQGAHHE